MKTGIIRRLDDLGRIVIPKEIRRSLRLGENDPLEISIEDKKLVLEPYSKLSEAELTLEPCMNAFRKHHGISLAVTTKNDIVSTIYVSAPKGTPLTDELAGIISEGKEYIADDTQIFLTDMCRKTVSAVFPVMTGSDCFGAVVLINSNGRSAILYWTKERETDIIKKTANKIVVSEANGDFVCAGGEKCHREKRLIVILTSWTVNTKLNKKQRDKSSYKRIRRTVAESGMKSEIVKPMNVIRE